MRPALAVGVAIVMGLTPAPQGPRAQAEPELGAAHYAREVERIRAHLAAVEAELASRGTEGLEPSRRAARERHLEVLRGYRERGRFPHNHRFDGRIPVFVDEHGTHCAVGYLLHRDGLDDLVELVRASANTARVPDLAVHPELGPALAAWLHEAGLTLEEAARIQPEYVPRPEAPAGPAVSPGQVAGSVFADGAAAVSIALNASPTSGQRGGWSGLLGVASGAVALGVGVKNMSDPALAALALGFVNIALGSAATYHGLRHFAGREGGHGTTREAARFTPVVAATRGGGAALGVQLRF